MLHKNMPAADQHPILAWSVADLTARAALSLTSADNGKVCKVASPLAHYILSDYSVPTWIQIDYTAASFAYEDVTSAIYTLVLGDSGKLKSFTNALASTVTVPANASVAFPIGTRIWCAQLGAGRTFFQGAAGVVLYSPTAWKTTKQQYSTVLLTKIATDVWLMSDEVGESGATSAGGDQYWDSVVLALRGEGANNSTTIIDDSISNRTVTVAGNAKISTTQFKYGAASLAFDGTGDYISVPYVQADFDWWTSDFTLEFWIRPADLSTCSYVDGGVTKSVCIGCADTGSTSNYWSFGIIADGTVKFCYDNGSQQNSAHSTVLTVNTWNHLALVKTASGIQIFVNGVGNTVAAVVGTPQSSTSGVVLAIGQINNRSLNGYIDDLRITKGVARYTATFTPPTATFDIYRSPDYDPSWASVVLALHGEGANSSTTITDKSSSNKTVTVIGNAQISTAQFKYGSSSILLDGSGDGLSIPDDASLRFGTGNFTLEFYIQWTSLTGYQTLFTKGYAGTGSLLIQTGNGDGKLSIYQGAVSTLVVSETTGTININQWYHIAVSRVGTTIYIFRDGVQTGSATDSTDYNNTSICYIGGGSSTGFNNYYVAGYLDEFRITKGVGRYSKPFTPPTRAFPEVAT